MGFGKGGFVKYPFEEYYFIGKPGDIDTIDYYFYKPEYAPENWATSNLVEISDQVICFSGRWRFQSPRRQYNEEMSQIEEMFIVHKDAKVEDIIKDYNCSIEEATAIVEVIGIHKKEKYKLDYLVDIMWNRMNLIERTTVDKRKSDE